MSTKICPKCNTEKPLDQFYKRTSGKPQSWCIPCSCGHRSTSIKVRTTSSTDTRKCGMALRLARTWAGITQPEMAAACGTDQRTVSEYENGRFNVFCWKSELANKKRVAKFHKLLVNWTGLCKSVWPAGSEAALAALAGVMLSQDPGAEDRAALNELLASMVTADEWPGGDG